MTDPLAANRSRRASRGQVAVLGGILLLGLALRLVGFGWGLPNRLGPDEPPFHPDEKVGVVQGSRLYSDPTGTTFIWGGAFYMRTAQWLRIATSPFADAPEADLGLVRTIVALRALNVLAALATAALVAWMAHLLAGPTLAALAMALFLFFPGPVLDAHYARPDVLMALLCATSLSFALLFARGGQPRALWAGAFAGGLATGTMLSGVICFVPLLVAWFEADPGALRRPKRWIAALIQIGSGGLVGWLAGNFEALIAWDAFLDGLGISSRTHNSGGYSLPTALLGNISLYTFGSVASVAGYAGVALFVWRRQPGMLTVASSLLAGYLALGRVGGGMMRHLEFIAPAVAIAAAYALLAASDLASTPRKRRAWAVGLGTFAAAFTLQLSAGYVSPLEFEMDPRDRTGRWLLERLPRGSTVGVTESFAHDWSFSPRLPSHAPFQRVPLLLRAGADTSRYLDAGLDYIVTSNFAVHRARNPAAQRFIEELFSERDYEQVHVEEFSRSPWSLPDALGMRRPGDLFYVTPTFYIFARR